MLASRPTQTRYVVDGTPVRHTANFLATTVDFRILPPPGMSRTALARALGLAVARLRTVETAFTPPRFWRRPAADRVRAAVTAGVMAGCRKVRDATSGYFDPWAMPGGFDPAGLLTGWALERAAVALTDSGLTDFALAAGDELLVRGGAGGGNAWLVGIRHPANHLSVAVTDAALSTSTGLVVDPHTQRPADHWAAVTVLGPDLGIADAYATALRAAGPAGLSWFPSADGYRTVLLSEPRPEDTLTDLHPAA